MKFSILNQKYAVELEWLQKSKIVIFCLIGRKSSSSLGGSLSRDDVSIKILVIV